MRLEEVNELHYITPMDNVPSILKYGILSNNRVKQFGLTPSSVSDPDVQRLRSRKSPIRYPDGRRRPLHSFVNLYFNARNPMMSVCRDHHLSLCVLRVHLDVIRLDDVLVADMNAARNARIMPMPEGLRNVDGDLVYARSWKYPDSPEREYYHKGVMCAEVLVPDRLPITYLMGAYVSDASSTSIMLDYAFDRDLAVDPDMFFQSRRYP